MKTSVFLIKKLTACIFLLLFMAAPQGVYPADAAGRFQARIYHGEGDSSLPYRLLVPKRIDKTKKYPLVLFLHGAGERGSDNKKQVFAGLNIFADEKKMEHYPCFIAAPQCPEEDKWVDVEWHAEHHAMKDKPTEPLALSIKIIGLLQKEFPVDPARIYVVGYSMGGFGSWEAIQRWPQLFAAAVPVCGGGDETLAGRIARIPVWAFHGELDPTVKVIRSRNMINAIVKEGGMPRYTEYPDINHYSWGVAFSDPQLFEWLFRQKK